MEERQGANWGISEQKQALPFILNHYQETTEGNMDGEGEREVGADREEAHETKALAQSMARGHIKAPCYKGRIWWEQVYVDDFPDSREATCE